MTIVEDIKAKLDIVKYIESQGVPLRRSGRHWKACCPFHRETTASFMVSEEHQTWHCFGACQAQGDVFEFAMRKNNWTFQEALENLAKLAGVELPKHGPRFDHLDKLRGLLAAAAESYHRCLVDYEGAAAMRAYVRERGLSDETVERFQIGYAPAAWQGMTAHLRKLGYEDNDLVAAGVAVKGDKGLYDALRDRLIIPIRDERGRVVAFAGRGGEPKYLNTPQTALFSKGHLLFGFDRKAVRSAGTVVIVEGYMDAISAHQAGFTNVVAQMGTGLTDEQMKLVADYRIVLALDGDEAGQIATRHNLEQAIKSSRDVRILTLPEDCDPDDVFRETPKEWPVMVAESVPAADYLIGQIALPASAPVAEREAEALKLLPLLLATESDLIRRDSIQKLAMRLKLPERELLAHAHAKPQASPVTVTAPEKPGLPPVEAFVLGALLHNDDLYWSAARQLSDLGMHPMEADDFSSSELRQLMALIIVALQGDESSDVLTVPEFVAAYAPPILLELELPKQDVEPRVFVEQALRLRLRRVRENATYCDDLAQVRAYNRDKALLMLALARR